MCASFLISHFLCVVRAAGWASLMAMGEDGYNQHTRDILAVTQEIAAGVREIQGLRLLGGTPQAMIVCFAGTCTFMCVLACICLDVAGL